MKWLKKLFGKNTQNLYHVRYEKSHVTGLFDDLSQCLDKKRRLESYLNELLQKEEILKKYDLLDEEDINRLVLLGGKHKGIEERRDLLRGRLIKNNAALNRLTPFEDTLPEMIKELGEAERKFKESERDLFYLEEEYEALKEDRQTLIKGYRFLKGFSIAVLGILIIVLFVVFALLQTLRESVWIYLSVVGCGLVLFAAGIVFCKEALEKKLRDNEILQKKAVRYSNKTKIRAFHNKNYLDFQFTKLGVDSVAKLEMYYNRYLKSKSDEVSYAQLTRGLIQVEQEIESLFEVKGISFEEFDSVEEWLVAPKRAKALEQTVGERDKIQMQIQALDTYEQELKQEIILLESDPELGELVKIKLKECEEVRLMLDKKQKSE
ncbi:MAG: hypothetical protein ACRCW2_00235 [Cellulosilyticaceae bacterium]